MLTICTEIKKLKRLHLYKIKVIKKCHFIKKSRVYKFKGNYKSYNHEISIKYHKKRFIKENLFF